VKISYSSFVEVKSNEQNYFLYMIVLLLPAKHTSKKNARLDWLSCSESFFGHLRRNASKDAIIREATCTEIMAREMESRERQRKRYKVRKKEVERLSSRAENTLTGEGEAFN